MERESQADRRALNSHRELGLGEEGGLGPTEGSLCEH